MEITYTLEQIKDAASTLIKNTDDKILLFHGDMGTGKTTLIQQLVNELGGDAKQVSSPTFSLVNEYEVKNSLVYHFDFYRIDNEEEAYDIGIEDYLDSEHWIFIEWPNKIEKILHFIGKNVYLIRNDDETRTLKLEKQTNLT